MTCTAGPGFAHTRPPVHARGGQVRTHGAFTGKSARILQLTHEIQRAADSHSPVLVNGEPGVGKALAAREIHARSARAQRAFVRVHCAGLSEMLLDSELFGHVGGSFTGAYRDRHGKLALAHHGTIYIDDVGELTLASQAKLLRFIDTGEVQQVGADRVTSVADVRVIVATGRRFAHSSRAGCFVPTCSNGSARRTSSCRRCASASKTSRRSRKNSGSALPRRIARESVRSAPKRCRRCAATPGRATSANSKR